MARANYPYERALTWMLVAAFISATVRISVWFSYPRALRQQGLPHTIEGLAATSFDIFFLGVGVLRVLGIYRTTGKFPFYSFFPKSRERVAQLELQRESVGSESASV